MTKPGKSPFQIISNVKRENSEADRPTILAIDSTQKEEITLALLCSGTNSIVNKYTSRAQDLQQLITQFLTDNSLTVSDLTAIAVYRIADSLTGTRMGITTANTLAWLHNIPVIELDTQTFSTGLKLLEKSPETLQIVSQSKPLG